MQNEKTRGYLNSRGDTLTVHLKRCTYQPREIQLKAAETLAASRKKKGRMANTRGDEDSGSASGGHYSDPDVRLSQGQPHMFPAGYVDQSFMYVPLLTRFSELQLGGGAVPGLSNVSHSIHAARSLPQLNTDIGEAHFARASSSPGGYLMSWPQSLSGTQTPLSHASSASSSPLMHHASMELPHSPSPFSGPIRNQPHRSSSRRLRPYPSLTSALPWNAARQSLYNSLVTRLTASANFPLSWVENPVWLEFCDEFLPSAKIPSRRVLTTRLLPEEVKSFVAQAIKQTTDGDATMQADGWTGLNYHHLLAFMITANRTVRTTIL